MTSPDTHAAHHDDQRAHFDGDSLANPRMVVADTPYVQAHVDRLATHAGLEPGMSILDVGCGLGKFTLPLIDRGFDVTGLDLSQPLLDDLTARLERDPDRSPIELHCADVAHPPAELLGRFDVVTGFFMLHHLPDLVAAFDGVRRCLRPGGTAVFLEPNAYSPLYPVQITVTPTMRWRADKGVFNMRRANLQRSMEAAGLTDITHRWTGLCPPFVTNVGGGRGAAVDRGIDRLPFGRPLRSFQVIAGRSAV